MIETDLEYFNQMTLKDFNVSTIKLAVSDDSQWVSFMTPRARIWTFQWDGTRLTRVRHACAFRSISPSVFETLDKIEMDDDSYEKFEDENYKDNDITLREIANGIKRLKKEC